MTLVSFLSSVTSWFKPKPADTPSQGAHTEEKPLLPHGAASHSAGDAAPASHAGPHPQEPPASVVPVLVVDKPAEIHTTHNTTSDHQENSGRAADPHSELDGASDVREQHREATAEARSVAHEVLERVDSLGSLDQQRSDEIEKAIQAAEAETAIKIEKIKSEKKGDKKDDKEEEQERKNWLAKARENIKYTFISKETYVFSSFFQLPPPSAFSFPLFLSSFLLYFHLPK